MNRAQVKFVLDMIEHDVDNKTSNIFDRINSNDNPIETKTIYSMLNDSIKDFDENAKIVRKIEHYFAEKKINDISLKDLTTVYESKYSSIKELKKDIYSFLIGKQKTYEKIVYSLGYEINKSNYEDDEISSSVIANKLNKDRIAVGIENSFPKYEYILFDNYKISASQMADFNNNDTIANLSKFGSFLLKNLHFNLIIDSECSEPFIDGKNVVIPKQYTISNKTNGTGPMLGVLNATYLVVNKLVDVNSEEVLEKYSKKSSDVESTRMLLNNKDVEIKQNALDKSNEIVKLLTTLNVLRFAVEPDCYKPLEQVVLTRVDSLFTDLSKLFNDDGLVYVISKQVEANSAEILKRVKMNSSDAEKVYHLTGVKFNGDYKHADEMFVANQTYTLKPDFISGYDSTVVEFDYNGILYNDVYLKSHKKYEDYFSKMTGKPIASFTKIDMNAQSDRVKKLYNRINQLEEKFRALKKVHKSQYDSICDICAYLDCAKQNIENINLENFDNKILKIEKNLETIDIIEPKEQPNEHFVNPMVKSSVETPTKVDTIKIVEQPIEKPVEQPMEKPVEQKVDEQEVVEQPVEIPTKVDSIKVEEKPISKKEESYNSFFTFMPTYGPTYTIGSQREVAKKQPKIEVPVEHKETPKVEKKEVSLKDQVKAYLYGELKNAISELVSDNLSELDTEINDINKYHTADEIKQCSMIMSSLNTLIKLPDGDNTVKNLYVAMGKKEQYVNLLKLKEILFNDFIGKLTDYIISNVNNTNGKNIREIVNESLIKLNEKHIYDLEQKRLSLIDMQTSLLIPGYADMVDKITNKYDNVISNAKIAYEVEKDEIGEEQAQQKLKERISRAEQLKQIEINNIVKDNLPDENYIEYDDIIKGIDKKFYGSKNNFADRGLIGKVKENLTFEMLKFSLIDLSKTLYHNNQFNPNTKIDGKLIDEILDTVFVNNKKSHICCDELIH